MDAPPDMVVPTLRYRDPAAAIVTKPYDRPYGSREYSGTYRGEPGGSAG